MALEHHTFWVCSLCGIFLYFMSEVLKDLNFCFTYLDDILIFSPSWEEHTNHIPLVFKRLKKEELKIKLGQCWFFKQSLHYLGHVISDDGIKPLPEKTEAIEAFIPPTNVNEVHHFLGLTGYYHKFVPLYVVMAKPLNNLLCKRTPCLWSE